MKHSDDQSLFAWNFPLEHRTLSRPILFSFFIMDRTERYVDEALYCRRVCGILAPSPADLAGSGSIISCEGDSPGSPLSMKNRGIHIDLPIFWSSFYRVSLPLCWIPDSQLQMGNFERPISHSKPPRRI